MKLYKSLVQRSGKISGFEVNDYIIICRTKEQEKALEETSAFKNKTIIEYIIPDKEAMDIERAKTAINSPILNLFTPEEILQIKLLPKEAMATIRKNIMEMVEYYEQNSQEKQKTKSNKEKNKQ